MSQPGALDGAAKLLVGVSGGADSVALLHILRSVRSELGVALHVASLDHGIRCNAGAQDLAFVGKLAEDMGVACALERCGAPALAREWGMGMEAAARRARYEFLARIARLSNAECVAVAHHADDQAETLLLHIARGSGLRGLQGMRPVSPMPYAPDIRLLRPLLGVSRADIEAYCAERDLEHRFDESNNDTRYQRNFIRAEVMPRLREVNPAVASALGRLADNAATDEDFIARQLESIALPLVQRTDDAWQFAKADYASLHVALRRRLLRRAFATLGGAELAHEGVIELDAWARSARVGTWRDMGAGVRLRSDYDSLIVERLGASRDAACNRLIPADTDMKLEPGQAYSQDGIEIRILPHRVTDVATGIPLPATAELRLRTRKPGDRFKPRGMGGRSRKLKDWFIDRKVPRAQRDRIPLLCANGEIIAICLAKRWHLAHIETAKSENGVTAVLD